MDVCFVVGILFCLNPLFSASHMQGVVLPPFKAGLEILFNVVEHLYIVWVAGSAQFVFSRSVVLSNRESMSLVTVIPIWVHRLLSSSSIRNVRGA